MLELWKKIKDSVFEVLLGTSLLLGGFIALLLSKTKRQDARIASLETEVKAKDSLKDYEVQKEKAADAEKEYNDTKSFYSDILNKPGSDN